MINYLPKFSARLSELALPIRELAKDKLHLLGAQNIKQLSSW